MLLVPVRVDRLAEVAMPVEQPYRHERERHVGGGLAMVARQDPQSARVDAQRFVEPELGAAIGDRTVELVAVVALEPVVRAVRHVGIELRELRSQDRFLLCSDGLYRELSDADLGRHLSGNDPEGAYRALMKHALSGACSDNVSAIVVQFTGS